MKTPPELYQIEEPEAPVERSLTCIQSHGSAEEARPLGAPWPPQLPWEDFLRRWKKQYPA